MLPQQTNGVQASSGNSGRNPPKGTDKQPTVTYMFIDSSNGGVNAKPDKDVRSFVMKRARNKRAWSTRPRTLKDETITGKAPRPLTTSPSYSYDIQHRVVESRISKDHWHTILSPSSSRSNSVYSSRSSNWTCDSSVSIHTSASDHDQADDDHNFLYQRAAAAAQRNGLTPGFSRSFGYLAVRLDSIGEELLHHCKFLLPSLHHVTNEDSSRRSVNTSGTTDRSTWFRPGKGYGLGHLVSPQLRRRAFHLRGVDHISTRSQARPKLLQRLVHFRSEQAYT